MESTATREGNMLHKIIDRMFYASLALALVAPVVVVVVAYVLGY